jgi:hypothetical protein
VNNETNSNAVVADITPTATDDSKSITNTEDQVTAPAEKLSNKSIVDATTSTSPGREITDTERQMLLTQIGGKKSVKTMRTIAENAIDEFSTTKWSLIEYCGIGTAKSHDNFGRMLKVRGVISDLQDPQPRFLTDKDEEQFFDTTQFILTEPSGENIESTLVTGKSFHLQLHELHSHGKPVEVLGTVVPVAIYTPQNDIKRYSYRFLPFVVLPSDDPIQIIKAGNAELAEVEKLVDELKDTPNGIIDHIKAQLVDQIGIKGLEDTPELDRCLDFTILQGMSDGYQPERNLSLRLDSLVIGPPGVGKKLLAQSAKILNPVYTEGHPAKLTVAGISGTSVYKNQSWHSTPGLIPQANRGVFIIQDFHNVVNKKGVMDVLSLVMEDGRVIDSTSARSTHPALTAIHLDMNRQAQLYIKRNGDEQVPRPMKIMDLGIPMNVLTRFDFIAEIPRDVERQMEVALSMQQGPIRSHSAVKESAKAVQARELTTLVAYLRTRYDEIEIPAGISVRIVEKQRKLLDMNRNRLPNLEVLGDFQTRLSNSIVKLIFASARANARNIATLTDVETAFHFVRTKLDFLSQIEQFDTPADWDKTPVTSKVRERREKIVYTFGGREVSAKQVHEEMMEDGVTLKELTIRRDLEKVAKHVRFGVFKVPGKQKPLTDSDAAVPLAE